MGVEVFNTEGIPTSVKKHIVLEKLATTIYKTNLTPQFGVGTVPNGGYVASLFLTVTGAHAGPWGHPDIISARWDFLNRTQSGSALLVIDETKLGREMSVLHITLYQDGVLNAAPWVTQSTRRLVVAYVTCTKLSAETGTTLDTKWKLSHPPPGVDFSQLKSNSDPSWQRVESWLQAKVPQYRNMELYARRSGHPLPATLDFWARYANRDRITNADLGYVADAAAPYLVDNYRAKSRGGPTPENCIPYDMTFWCPTLSMDLDVKNELSVGGTEWLHIRSSAKRIKNGRLDTEVIVMDEAGYVVCLSRHVAMVVEASRNYSNREYEWDTKL